MKAGWKVTVHCKAFFWGKKEKKKGKKVCRFETYNSLHLRFCPSNRYLLQGYFCIKKKHLYRVFHCKKITLLQKLPWLSNTQEWLSLSGLSILWESIICFYSFNQFMPSWLMLSEFPIPHWIGPIYLQTESHNRTYVFACRDWSSLIKRHSKSRTR